jgi:hypothetical protein
VLASKVVTLGDHRFLRRGIALLAVSASSLGACTKAAHELERGPAGRGGASAVAEALALRFGPMEREPEFDALRPKLAQAALVPSRVFDDHAAWPVEGSTWRTVEFAGRETDGVYRMGVRAEAPEPVVVGQYRGRLRLERVDGGRYEWTLREDLAIGRVRPADLAAALDALLEGAEAVDEHAARAAIAATFPRTSHWLGLVLRLETLALARDAYGATNVRIGVRLAPEGLRAVAPRYAAFLQRYLSPIRVGLVVADEAGARWWALNGESNLWTLQLRVRGGSLVPLDGPAERRIPPLLRATSDYATRMGRFHIEAQHLVADVTLTRTPLEKGFLARFRQEPAWDLPFLVESLLGGPLGFPFEGAGSEAGWAAQEVPSGGTRVVRQYRVRVHETFILRWLGGMTNQAVSEFRAGAEREADWFNGQCLVALRDDFAALAAAP